MANIASNSCSCSRRTAIRSLAAGSILLPGIIQQLLADEDKAHVNPLAPRAPHFAAKAKRVIFMYMTGGVSHMDSFDPKPKLVADHGKPVNNKPGAATYLRTSWDFKPRGKSGIEVTELFPHIAE